MRQGSFKRGDTLIEVLVAMSVAALVIGCLFSLRTNTVRANASVEIKSQCENVVASIREYYDVYGNEVVDYQIDYEQLAWANEYYGQTEVGQYYKYYKNEYIYAAYYDENLNIIPFSDETTVREYKILFNPIVHIEATTDTIEKYEMSNDNLEITCIRLSDNEDISEISEKFNLIKTAMLLKYSENKNIVRENEKTLDNEQVAWANHFFGTNSDEAKYYKHIQDNLFVGYLNIDFEPVNVINAEIEDDIYYCAFFNPYGEDNKINNNNLEVSIIDFKTKQEIISNVQYSFSKISTDFYTIDTFNTIASYFEEQYKTNNFEDFLTLLDKHSSSLYMYYYFDKYGNFIDNYYQLPDYEKDDAVFMCRIEYGKNFIVHFYRNVDDEFKYLKTIDYGFNESYFINEVKNAYFLLSQNMNSIKLTFNNHFVYVDGNSDYEILIKKPDSESIDNSLRFVKKDNFGLLSLIDLNSPDLIVYYSQEGEVINYQITEGILDTDANNVVIENSANESDYYYKLTYTINNENSNKILSSITLVDKDNNILIDHYNFNNLNNLLSLDKSSNETTNLTFNLGNDILSTYQNIISYYRQNTSLLSDNAKDKYYLLKYEDNDPTKPFIYSGTFSNENELSNDWNYLISISLKNGNYVFKCIYKKVVIDSETESHFENEVLLMNFYSVTSFDYAKKFFELLNNNFLNTNLSFDDWRKTYFEKDNGFKADIKEINVNDNIEIKTNQYSYYFDNKFKQCHEENKEYTVNIYSYNDNTNIRNVIEIEKDSNILFSSDFKPAETVNNNINLELNLQNISLTLANSSNINVLNGITHKLEYKNIIYDENRNNVKFILSFENATKLTKQPLVSIMTNGNIVTYTYLLEDFELDESDRIYIFTLEYSDDTLKELNSIKLTSSIDNGEDAYILITGSNTDE